ncbi:iron chelate uptake ABC transporter family permease subunit [Gracilibacillus salitolerans]|uniref:Iron chelate uptake ABC transporter family permease subunit n=1 Tax=Gracilibacillus salitolerans TaxID=2663022 RepID=A0A5Q2TLR2_9BACI|nr:iron ABC transporter permease [Gracilibacillus salitolerans]QGH35022.1 iron chelate uptake ABC transporter family permease subunit [Gracilibacillus salitolerans]
MQITPKKTKQKWIVFIVSFLIFIVAFILSISLGQRQIALSTTLDAIFYYDESVTEHIIVVTSRLTRAVIATVIGTSLAMAGAMMQALTRNPLAAPDILGINAGAIFFIVLAITLFSVDSLVHYMWIAFIGAAIAALCVYFLGTIGTRGLSPIRIVLSGAAVSALFVSFTQALLVIDEQRIQSILFWLAGSVAGRSMDMLLPIFPFILCGVLLALLLGGSINILLSGEDVAKGLGQKIILLKILIGVVVVLLAGGSVAIGGSIGFIGLIVPHMVRGLVGPDYRWILPVSAFIGAGLLLLADVVARFLIMPQEVPVGVMTALIGTPFFIYIARRGLS